jgi:O-antigen ligase
LAGRSSSLSLLHLVMALPMLMAAFAGLPRLINVGPISGMGAITIVNTGLAAAALLACQNYPKRLLLRWLPYMVFLMWAAMSVTWDPPGSTGIQNGLVYSFFGLLVLLSGTLAFRNPGRVQYVIDRSFLWIDCVSLGLVALELSVHGLTKDTEEGWWIGPRPLAILGVLVVSRHLARWYYGSGAARISIVLWMCAMVVSVSRSATAAALLLVGLVVLAQVRFRLKRAALSIPAAAGAVLIIVALALYWKPLHDHMFVGDTKLQIGGTKINVSGRFTMWGAVVASGSEHPWTGQGLGSSQGIVYSAFAGHETQMTQPHNDYLRLWHDLGVVGLFLYLMAVGTWMWTLGREWYRAEGRRTSAEMEFTALLALVALSLLAVTDNPLVYQPIMAVSGVLVGAGLGAGANRQAQASRVRVLDHRPGVPRLEGAREPA